MIIFTPHQRWWRWCQLSGQSKIPQTSKSSYIFTNFLCMGEIFCVKLQRVVPLKVHSKYLTHTMKDMLFHTALYFKSSSILELIHNFETLIYWVHRLNCWNMNGSYEHGSWISVLYLIVGWENPTDMMGVVMRKPHWLQVDFSYKI